MTNPDYRLLRRLLRFVRPYRRYVAAGLSAWLVIAILDTLIPQFIARAIDLGIDRKDSNALILFAGLASGFFILRAGANYAYGFLFRYWEHRIAKDMRNLYYRTLMRLDWSFFDRATSGDLITRGIGDVDQMRIWTGTGLVEMVTTVGQFLAMFIVMFLVSWKLALVSLTAVPVLAVLAVYFGKGAVPRISTVMRLGGLVTNKLAENLYGIRVVRAYSRERDEMGRYNTEARNYLEAQIVWNNFWALLVPSMGMVSAFGTAVVLGVGGSMVLAGGLTIGQLVAFNVYLARLLQAVRRAGPMLQRAASAVSSSSRFFAITDAVPDIRDAPNAVPLAVEAGRVEFRDVTLRYGQADPVLKGVSFQAPPGRTIAIVGPTGAGKSSIVQLLDRFYDPTEGAVLIDGQRWAKPNYGLGTARELRVQVGRHHMKVILVEVKPHGAGAMPSVK